MDLEKPRLMTFGETQERPFADLVLGHIPFADMVALIKERYTIDDDDELPNPSRMRYDYAIFQDDEAVLFNCRPNEPKAKQVTVAYYRWVPVQDDPPAKPDEAATDEAPHG